MNNSVATSKSTSVGEYQQSESADYRINHYVYRIARAEDGTALKTTLRNNPMPSWVQLSFEREPDYFAADKLMGESVTVIVEKQQQDTDVAGMYHCSSMPVYVDGQPETVPYIGSLRANSAYRNRVYLLKHGYQSIGKLLPQGTLPLYFTSIASENTKARRILEANLKGMPRYRLLGEMHTLGIATAKGKNNSLMQIATSDDVPELVRFYNQHAHHYQFAAVLDEKWLRKLDGSNGLQLNDFWLYKEGDEIRACMAIWDQRTFKQTVVHGYRFPLNRLRGVYNMLAKILGWISLPAVGGKLQQVYVSFLAIDERSEAKAMLLIREGLFHAGRKNAQVAVIGLSEKNPLLIPVMKSLPCQVYRTCIESVVLNGMAPVEVDERPPQPEVAIL